MGENAKAIAVFMALMTELPDNVKIVLTYWVQQLPRFPNWPEMVQGAVLVILVKLPVAGAVAGLTWWVKNHTAPPVFGTLDRPLGRPLSLASDHGEQ